jgi:hypothetical protein
MSVLTTHATLWPSMLTIAGSSSSTTTLRVTSTAFACGAMTSPINRNTSASLVGVRRNGIASMTVMGVLTSWQPATVRPSPGSTSAR